jgi:hypothetical protein
LVWGVGLVRAASKKFMREEKAAAAGAMGKQSAGAGEAGQELEARVGSTLPQPPPKDAGETSAAKHAAASAVLARSGSGGGDDDVFITPMNSISMPRDDDARAAAAAAATDASTSARGSLPAIYVRDVELEAPSSGRSKSLPHGVHGGAGAGAGGVLAGIAHLGQSILTSTAAAGKTLAHLSAPRTLSMMSLSYQRDLSMLSGGSSSPSGGTGRSNKLLSKHKLELISPRKTPVKKKLYEPPNLEKAMAHMQSFRQHMYGSEKDGNGGGKDGGGSGGEKKKLETSLRIGGVGARVRAASWNPPRV